MIIAVDFDGTVVEHKYPEIGNDVPGAAEVLLRLQSEGARFILWTMRSGIYLDAAVEWFRKRDVGLIGINENPVQKEWTDSPKAYAHAYIDDAAVGCPLLAGVGGGRPIVDWAKIAEWWENTKTS